MTVTIYLRNEKISEFTITELTKINGVFPGYKTIVYENEYDEFSLDPKRTYSFIGKSKKFTAIGSDILCLKFSSKDGE